MTSLKELYERHPLNAQSILRRIAQQSNGRMGKLSEEDLAIDLKTQLTDQNHIGGAEFVSELAERVGISSASTIVDLGCGLGGPARLLASRWGCHVLGIEVIERRYNDAKKLTKLVGLEQYVTFSWGDFLAIPVPARKFDVLWGQGAWTHVKKKRDFINRWLPTLKSGGRIALEDFINYRKPRRGNETRVLRRLAGIWKAYIVSLDEWKVILQAGGCSVSICEDLSEQALTDCIRTLVAVDQIQGYPASERNAFAYAIDMLRKGLLGYVRIVAVKS
jgi:ubiquinone/menaquinone biosynthesis C-methylase UbiE